MITTVVEGREYRLLAPFSPHSGILGICFVPVDGNFSMVEANEALKKVRRYLSSDRDTPISCSAYTLSFDSFNSSALPELKEEFLEPQLDWTGVDKMEFIRCVFRQAGQDQVVLRFLPQLITKKFGDPRSVTVT